MKTKLSQRARITQIACAFCRGRGMDPFGIASKLSECQVCSGRGKIAVKTPYEKCPVCRGTGIFSGHRLPCAVCGGVGAVSNIKGHKRCVRCDNGAIDIRTSLPCANCYSLGVE